MVSVLLMWGMWFAIDSFGCANGWESSSSFALWIVVWAIYGQLQPHTFMGKLSIILSWILFIFTLGCIGGQALKSSRE